MPKREHIAIGCPPFEVCFTHDFVCRFLPRGCKRILEVGCGTGELAAYLSRNGLEITAIDSDEKSVAKARRRGLNVHHREWPEFAGTAFDAVLFTRSLHHIHPLGSAAKAAAKCLRRGGRVIVEDFAYESTDERTLRWFVSAIKIVAASGLLRQRRRLLDDLLQKSESLAAWRGNHQHELSTARQITSVLRQIFGNIITEHAPYYFRYVANIVDRSKQRDAMIRALAAQEDELISSGAITSLGRRFVATRR